jgi:hypothetical protein
MTDEELRGLVRDAIARHLGGSSPTAERSTAVGSAGQEPPWRAHPSFGRFLLAAGEADGGACLIEPGVRCDHCGFCQSYGH